MYLTDEESALLHLMVRKQIINRIDVDRHPELQMARLGHHKE